MLEVRKESQKSYVYESHKRCINMGMDSSLIFSKKILHGKDFEDKLNHNKELILNATPFIDELYNFVKGSNFFAILTDGEGCILNVIGDEGILSDAFKFKMIPGAYMDEAHIGTNAMSLVLTEKIPVQVSANEHYIKAYHKWTCSAAPIKDDVGNIMGVLNLTGYSEFVHSHTLGMVVAAAKAIERMIENNKKAAYKKSRRLADRILSCKAIYTFNKIIGQNEKFIQIIEYAKKISDSKSTILITGESGTGKEVFAQSIHNHSDRHNETFVAVNCGAIPRNLIESELFGYEEGAFTGAKRGGYAGKFEIADGGTIFLDEIGEMPLDMQIKLLRVIEEGIINKIGSSKQIPVNVRIIAATNKDLRSEAEKGSFRKDLYYRLNVLPVHLPPLRERRDDIPLLINYFMKKASKHLEKNIVEITDSQLEYFINYNWPGNIRELENIVELIINTESVPIELLAKNTSSEIFESNVPDECLRLEYMERQHIIKVLKRYNGNIAVAAKSLGIGRNTLYRKMNNYSIDCSVLERNSKMEQ